MRKPILLTAFILALLLNCPLSAGDDFPLVTADGLHRVPDTRLRQVYADPDADLGVYSKLLLVNGLDETMQVTSGRQGPREE